MDRWLILKPSIIWHKMSNTECQVALLYGLGQPIDKAALTWTQLQRKIPTTQKSTFFQVLAHGKKPIHW